MNARAIPSFTCADRPPLQTWKSHFPTAGPTEWPPPHDLRGRDVSAILRPAEGRPRRRSARAEGAVQGGYHLGRRTTRKAVCHVVTGSHTADHFLRTQGHQALADQGLARANAPGKHPPPPPLYQAYRT